MESIGLIAQFGTEVLRFVNDKKLMKHKDRMLELQKDITEEKARGQLSDDGKIESMEKEFYQEANAFLQQMALLGVRS